MFVENLRRALQAAQSANPEVTDITDWDPQRILKAEQVAQEMGIGIVFREPGRGLKRGAKATLELYPGETGSNGFWTRLNELTP